MTTASIKALVQRFNDSKRAIINSVCKAIHDDLVDCGRIALSKGWISASLNDKRYFCGTNTIEITTCIRGLKSQIFKAFNELYTDCELYNIDVTYSDTKWNSETNTCEPKSPHKLEYAVLINHTPQSDLILSYEDLEEVEELFKTYKTYVTNRDFSYMQPDCDFVIWINYKIKNESTAPLILKKSLERIADYLDIPRLELTSQYNKCGMCAIYFDMPL